MLNPYVSNFGYKESLERISLKQNQTMHRVYQKPVLVSLIAIYAPNWDIQNTIKILKIDSYISMKITV